MKRLMTFMFISLLAFSASADFIDSHDNLFKNSNLCDSQIEDQVDAENEFKTMFNILKNDEEQQQPSIIEVLDYSAYETRLKNTKTKAVCSIILHDDCYSAYCE